jgi:subtilisin family serine protease
MLPKRHNVLLLMLIAVMLISCGAPPGNPVPITPNPEVRPIAPAQLAELDPPSIVRHPEPCDMSWANHYHGTIPEYDPNSTDPFQIDLRSADLTKLDLSNNLEELLHSDFDSQTKWPPVDQLPPGLDLQKIMELGKDPGLGIRFLHEKGITGAGVGIAIIDQALLVDHVEYQDQIQLYEEDGNTGDCSMHGPAVASIAVGKTVGVAPDADLYFIASSCFNAASHETLDFACLANDIRRVIEINQGLPEGRKIRVLSMSISWEPQNIGYDEISAAVDEAYVSGIFVISTGISDSYGMRFHGLGRSPLSDPNDFQSYGPGSWWQEMFYSQGLTADTLLVPMDARSTASPTGFEDYAFSSSGGWSWCVPYLAGMYALAWQVRPGITPEQFWTTALQTGQTIQIQHGWRHYSFGVILDPQALIATLQK